MARIAFITPSSGENNGIGDYVRLFSEECVRQGHDVQIHALNEPHWTDSRHETVEVGSRSFEMHRWGQHLDYELKCRESRQLIESFKPDWISLQFEFYCYADRGNLGGLTSYLPAVLKGHRLHLMMHELWIRPNAGWDLREQAKGIVRYYQCRYLLKKIGPLCAHTSVEPYAREMRHLIPGIKLLPVPSNMPVYRGEPVPLPVEISETMPGERSKYLLVILFGRIVPEWDGRSCLKRVDDFAKQNSREVRLISIGGCGYNDLYWKQLVEQKPADWHAIKLGIREPIFISQTLQACDLAISSTPFVLSRKSSTTAAFLEHGLPVLFADKKPSDKEFAISSHELYRDQIYFGDQPLQPEVLTRPHKLADEAYSAVVTRQFLSDLKV